MSEFNISVAFENKLNALSPAVATAYENVNYAPVTGTPYQKVNLLPAQPENDTLGSDYYREVGLFQIGLYYPMNTGRGAAQARAQALKNHFKRGTVMTANGQTVRVIRTPQVSPSQIIGDRYFIAVSVFYRSEVFS